MQFTAGYKIELSVEESTLAAYAQSVTGYRTGLPEPFSVENDQIVLASAAEANALIECVRETAIVDGRIRRVAQTVLRSGKIEPTSYDQIERLQTYIRDCKQRKKAAKAFMCGLGLMAAFMEFDEQMSQSTVAMPEPGPYKLAA